MRTAQRKGAEEARNRLPELLDAAERGRSTIITKHGRPVAVLIPVDEYEPKARQKSLLPLIGSGRGLWGSDSSATIDALRSEWSR